MTRSPRHVRRNVQDAVGEHVRDLPIQAARLAMFGVGRALVLSDRLTKDYKELRESGPRPVLNRLRGDAQHLAGQVVTRVTERVGGSPWPATEERGGEAKVTEPETPVARAPAKVNRHLAAEPEIAVGKPADAPGTTAKATPKPARKAKIAAASLPVPDYDKATLASLRARLRGLSAAQVGLLHNYEQENAARPDVLRLFENRIAKLTAGH
jgi:hypothetical protein